MDIWPVTIVLKGPTPFKDGPVQLWTVLPIWILTVSINLVSTSNAQPRVSTSLFHFSSSFTEPLDCNLMEKWSEFCTPYRAIIWENWLRVVFLRRRQQVNGMLSRPMSPGKGSVSSKVLLEIKLFQKSASTLDSGMSTTELSLTQVLLSFRIMEIFK